MTKEQELLEQIVILLEKEGYKPKLLDNKTACSVTRIYRSVSYQCLFTVKYDASMLIFHTVSPIILENKDLGPISEFIAKANYGDTSGDFELDFSEMRIRYKTVAQWQKKPVDMIEVTNSLYNGVWQFEEFHVGVFEAIIDGSFS